MTDLEHGSGKPLSTTTTQVMYLLHALAPFTFWTLSLVAVIIGAFTRDGIRGTWIESHYGWLLRTFLWGLLWLVLATVLFVITVVGILFVWLPWGILTIWYLYRVLRGWLRLNEAQPAPQ